MAKVAKAKSTINTLLSQPPFDARIRKLSRPFGTGTTTIERGFMIWDTSVAFPPGYAKKNGPAVVKFLYNPSTISTSYMLADASAQSALNYPTASDPARLRVPLQQQTSFALLFDRTYELNVDKRNTDINNLGCDIDVRALRQFTGMFSQVYSGNNPGYTTNINTSSGSNSITQGIMQLTLAYVYFANPKRGIKYYGYIDSWQVQYTHFTQRMIPMRAVVNVSFTFLPPPVKSGVGSQAVGVGVSQLGVGRPGTVPNPTTGGIAGR